MTQTQLAKRLRQDQNWVSRIENGQRRIDVCELIMLAKVIEFDPHKALAAAMKANASR